MNIYQLFDDHLVANKRLLENKLKTQMQKAAQSSENQQDSVFKSYLPPYFLTSYLIWNLHFPQLRIALIRSHGNIITKTSYEILWKYNDVKRFVFYPCISRKCGKQLC